MPSAGAPDIAAYCEGVGMKARHVSAEMDSSIKRYDIELSPAVYRGESVDLYVNSTCNLKCKTCFLGDEYFSTVNNMSIQDAAKILEWAKQAGVRDVAFLGGEPSLHPNITDLLRLSRSIGIPANRFITNGSRPFQKLLSSAASKYIDVAYVSLDGPSAYLNDLIRGRGTFVQATRSMALLRENGIPFVITTSITMSSVGEVNSLIQLAEDSGCTTLNIHWVSPTGRAREGHFSVQPEAWVKLCREVMAYRPKREGLSIQCQAAYAWEGLEDLAGQGACAVRDRSNLQFMPDRSVYACGLAVDRPGLNAYRWTGESLTVRGGETELSICNTSPNHGCPLRQDVVREPFINGKNYIPLCIYQRVNNASD